MSVDLSKRLDGHEERITSLEVQTARSDEILSRLEATISKLDETVEKILAQVNQWRGSINVIYLLVGAMITVIVGIIVKVVSGNI